MPRGKFIVIEGLEGAGKSTSIKTVSAVLDDYGIHNQIMTREPGGTQIAERIRQLIKEGGEEELLHPKAELLMFYAARVQVVENVIKPGLKKGHWVIGDRHDLSTQAYQGGGRQLDHTFIAMLKENVLGDFMPDLTLYLDLPPDQGLARVRQRGELDHFEQESSDFFARTRDRYLQLVKADDSLVVIDASQPLEDVNLQIKSLITNWLESKVN